MLLKNLPCGVADVSSAKTTIVYQDRRPCQASCELFCGRAVRQGLRRLARRRNAPSRPRGVVVCARSRRTTRRRHPHDPRSCGAAADDTAEQYRSGQAKPPRPCREAEGAAPCRDAATAPARARRRVNGPLGGADEPGGFGRWHGAAPPSRPQAHAPAQVSTSGMHSV
jgi:hypothetical protein